MSIMSIISIITFLHSKLGGMDIPSWYLLLFISAFVVWLLLRGVYRAITSEWVSTSLFPFFLKHLVYPHLFPRISFVGTATRLYILIISAYLITNILLLTKIGVNGVKSTKDAGARAATMSIINMIPLLCGPRLSLMTGILGVSLRTIIGAHYWFGRTAVAEVLLHTIISLTTSQPFSWTPTNFAGVLGSSAIGLIFLLSIGFLKRLFYEWFLNLHQLLSIVMLIAVWRHIHLKNPAEIFLQIGIYLWTGLTLASWLFFAYRNCVTGRPFATAKATLLADSSNVMRVDIVVPRSWKIRAGQYVFLSIPELGPFTGLRGHPFMISWWSWSQKGLTISLLVKSRTGFTQVLARHTDKDLRAFIDGPYGLQHEFGDYGTVIMFATGIGIAGHIPYIKDLISGYNNCDVRTRRILLIWQIDKKSEMQCVKSWMDEVLDNDTGYARIYNSIEDSEYGTHSRIKERRDLPNIIEVLKNEFKPRQGKIIVSVCADRIMSDKVRKEVRRKMSEKVRFVELEFQPSLREIDQSLSTNMEFMCKG